MRNGLSFCLAVLLLSGAAQAKTGASHQSATVIGPPIFAPDRRVDVRVEKHVLYATMPGGEDAKMAILKRGTDSGVQCGGRSARSQPSVQARLVR